MDENETVSESVYHTYDRKSWLSIFAISQIDQMFDMYCSLFPCVGCRVNFPITWVSLVDILSITVTGRIFYKPTFAVMEICFSWNCDFSFLEKIILVLCQLIIFFNYFF